MKQLIDNLFGSLLLWQKFIILALLAAIMMTIPVGFYFMSTQQDITETQNEINGIKPSIALQKLLKLTQQHRGLSALVLGGNDASKPLREAMTKEIIIAIADLNSIFKESIPDQAITKNWTDAVQRWQKLQEQVGQSQIELADSFQEYSDLIEDYFVVMDQVADFFELTRDPVDASYYLMRSALYATPKLTESLGKARGKGAGVLSLKQATPLQRSMLSGFLGSSRDNQTEALNMLLKVYHLKPGIKSQLEPLSSAATKLYTDAIKLTTDEILIKQELSYDAKTYFNTYTTTINALFDLNAAAMAQFNGLLNDRKGKLETEQLTIFGGIATLFALVMFLGYLISGSITGPVDHLVSVMQKLAAGDNAVRANLQTFDEIGSMGRQFDMMVDQRELVTAKIQQENETMNNSIIDMLQAVSAIAQKDLTIKAPVAEDITGPLGDALNYLTDETVKVLNRVVQIAGDVSNVSKQVKTQSDTVLGIAEDEKREVDQSAIELGAASKAMLDIAKLAQSCNEAAAKAIVNTDKAQETVLGTVQGITSIRDTIRETEKRIKRLGERSQEIGSVVTIINTIAERTHILALNASMHAASAGEAGKGFAVIANEVQKLAENARQAASQISGLVNNIQVETADTVTNMNDAITQVVSGTSLAQQAGNEMRETRDTTAELVQLVQRIADSSKAQAKTSQRLQERSAQIQKASAQTFQKLQEQGVQTERLVDLSLGLVTSVGVFTLPENKMQKEGVHFNKSLIKGLVSDHKILLTEFTEMMDSAKNDNFYEANRLLSSFGTKLMQHFQVELVELYVYLNAMEKMMTVEEKKSIKGFSDEMYEIGATVKKLINNYINHPMSAANKESFINEFNGAAGILLSRIDREESVLYPLYGKYGRLG